MIDSLVRVSRRDGEAVITPRLFNSSTNLLPPLNNLAFAFILINAHVHQQQCMHHSTTPTLNPSTISSTISLFFQSAFHLSLTVLVRYRSLEHI